MHYCKYRVGSVCLKCLLPTAEVFGQNAKFWAEIADADATKEQVNLVRRNVEPRGWVLDLACGTARHTIALCESGYCMVGLDVSLELLQVAKRKAAQAKTDLTLVRADMRFLPFQPNGFEAVVSLDQSVGYMATETDERASFKEVYEVLDFGGVFVVDVFNRPYMEQHYEKKTTGSSRWLEYPSFWLNQTRTANQGILCDVWVFRDKTTNKQSTARHVTRLFGFAELKGILEDAGLCVQQTFGSYSEEVYSEDAHRLVVIAAKTLAPEQKSRQISRQS
jgi:ubiquinone/menaquinone biosynthesis C-methylase UbiE